MDIQVERLSAVIDAVASPRFYPSLLNWLEGFFAFDNAIVYAFERGRPPRCLIKTERENSDAVNQIYQQGAYLQDPFYRALNDGGEGEVLTLRQLAPCGFYHSDYYRNFIARPAGTMRPACCCSRRRNAGWGVLRLGAPHGGGALPAAGGSAQRADAGESVRGCMAKWWRHRPRPTRGTTMARRRVIC